MIHYDTSNVLFELGLRFRLLNLSILIDETKSGKFSRLIDISPHHKNQTGK